MHEKRESNHEEFMLFVHENSVRRRLVGRHTKGTNLKHVQRSKYPSSQFSVPFVVCVGVAFMCTPEELHNEAIKAA